jgi:hypothetical protein
MRVVAPHDEHIFPSFAERSASVEAKGRVSALVRSEHLTVQPHRRHNARPRTADVRSPPGKWRGCLEAKAIRPGASGEILARSVARVPGVGQRDALPRGVVEARVFRSNHRVDSKAEARTFEGIDLARRGSHADCAGFG